MHTPGQAQDQPQPQATPIAAQVHRYPDHAPWYAANHRDGKCKTTFSSIAGIIGPGLTHGINVCRQFAATDHFAQIADDGAAGDVEFARGCDNEKGSLDQEIMG
jgi:hypothetical protein